MVMALMAGGAAFLDHPMDVAAIIGYMSESFLDGDPLALENRILQRTPDALMPRLPEIGGDVAALMQMIKIGEHVKSAHGALGQLLAPWWRRFAVRLPPDTGGHPSNDILEARGEFDKHLGVQLPTVAAHRHAQP